MILLAVDLSDQDGVGDSRQEPRPEGKILHVREQQPDCRIEGDRQKGGNDHRKVLGKCQRLEEPAFLGFERENGHERYRDHQQREKARPSDLLDGADHDRFEIPGPALHIPVLELLVRLLDYHDRRVHHGPDGDGNPAERHDIRGQVHFVHGDERDHHRDRYCDDRDQSARDVPEEDQNDQAYDEQLFRQGGFEGLDGSLDEVRAVVGGYQLDALGQVGFDLRELCLDPFDDAERVFTVAHDDDTANGLAFPVQIGDAAADVRAEHDVAKVLDQDGRAAFFIRTDDYILDVREISYVAAPAHHVFTAGKLHQAPADVVVAFPDRTGDPIDGDFVGEESVWIDVDLVLPDETANGGDFRNSGQ